MKERSLEHILPSQASEGTLQPCQSLDPGLSASRTVRQYISVVYATQLAMLGYGSPSKLTCLGFHDPAFSLYQNLVEREELRGWGMAEKGEGE